MLTPVALANSPVQPRTSANVKQKLKVKGNEPSLTHDRGYARPCAPLFQLGLALHSASLHSGETFN
jgi:hypothetical protein